MSNQPKYYDKIPSSGSDVAQANVTYFRYGKPIQPAKPEAAHDDSDVTVTVTTTIAVSDVDTSRAAQFSTAPEVDTDDGPTKPLYTPPADNAPTSCDATNVAPEDEDLGYTDNGVPIALLNEQIGQTGLTYGDLDRIISAIADEALQLGWDYYNGTFVPTVQSVGARKDRDGLRKLAGMWENVKQCFDVINNAELVRDYINRHE